MSYNNDNTRLVIAGGGHKFFIYDSSTLGSYYVLREITLVGIKNTVHITSDGSKVLVPNSD